MSAPRVIPIKPLARGAESEEAGAPLERAGFMRMMAMAEPQLSQFVARYKALGYEVELVPWEDEKTGVEVGCGTGCEAGGAASTSVATIFVRKRKPATGEG